MSFEAVFMRSGNLRRICELSDTSGNVHKVEPYAIFTSAKNRRHLLFYLLSSSVPEFQPGWKAQEARFFASGKMLEQNFTLRQDYDPLNKDAYPVMHYSLPTHDGRQRWVDKPGDEKKDRGVRPHIE